MSATYLRDDLENWFGGHSRDVAMILAWRAVMRAVPDLGALFQDGYPNANSVVLGSFHALSTVILSITGSRKLAEPAHAYFRAETQRIRFDKHIAILDAVDGLRLAVTSKSDKNTRVYLANAASEVSVVEDEAWQELTSERKSVEQGEAIDGILHCPLFFQAMSASPIAADPIGAAPGESSATPWYLFRDVLEQKSENWDVWISWYQYWFDGRLPEIAFEKAIHAMSEAEWQKTPSEANARLRELIEQNDDRPISVGTQILGDPVLGDQPPSRPAPTMGAPTMGRTAPVSASDRLVSVRHNQEPFDVLEEKLEQVLHELHQNQNAWKFHLETYENDLSLIQDVLEQKQAGEVDRESLSKLDRLLNRLTEKAGVIFWGALGGAALPGFVSMLNMAREAISKILGISG